MQRHGYELLGLRSKGRVMHGEAMAKLGYARQRKAAQWHSREKHSDGKGMAKNSKGIAKLGVAL